MEKRPVVFEITKFFVLGISLIGSQFISAAEVIVDTFNCDSTWECLSQNEADFERNTGRVSSTKSLSRKACVTDLKDQLMNSRACKAYEVSWVSLKPNQSSDPIEWVKGFRVWREYVSEEGFLFWSRVDQHAPPPPMPTPSEWRPRALARKQTFCREEREAETAEILELGECSYDPPSGLTICYFRFICRK